MMTCEEILSIEEYCIEHKVSNKKRLEELEVKTASLYSSADKQEE